MIITNKKIVILVPGENARGGVTNYFYSIKKDFPSNVVYHTRGVRTWPKKSGILKELFTHFTDYLKFIKIVMNKDVVLVQTNTSFDASSILRDGIFLLISKVFKKKTIVFFHGWDNKFVYNISGVYKKILVHIFFKSQAIIDLSEHNTAFLKNAGYKKNIYLETTLVDTKLVDNIDIDKCIENRINSKKKTILFLSRIEKAKGIYLLLETFKTIQKTHPEFHLIYAGDGLEMDLLKMEVAKQNILNVEFTGFVSGKKKQELFLNASIFVFLSEFEGMPSAVLEAMAFGLPVITTNVGGIASVFEDRRNGCLLNNTDIDFIAENIVKIVYNNEYRYLCETNYFDAKNKFWSNVVAKRIMCIYSTVIEAR